MCEYDTHPEKKKPWEHMLSLCEDYRMRLECHWKQFIVLYMQLQ